MGVINCLDGYPIGKHNNIVSSVSSVSVQVYDIVYVTPEADHDEDINVTARVSVNPVTYDFQMQIYKTAFPTAVALRWVLRDMNTLEETPLECDVYTLEDDQLHFKVGSCDYLYPAIQGQCPFVSFDVFGGNILAWKFKKPTFDDFKFQICAYWVSKINNVNNILVGCSETMIVPNKPTTPFIPLIPVIPVIPVIPQGQKGDSDGGFSIGLLSSLAAGVILFWLLVGKKKKKDGSDGEKALL